MHQHPQREILYTKPVSSSSLHYDVLCPNGYRNNSVFVVDRVSLQLCMPLSCPLTRSTLTKVHARGRRRLLDGLVSDLGRRQLISQYRTSPSSFLILLEACRSPKELNRSIPEPYSSPDPSLSINEMVGVAR